MTDDERNAAVGWWACAGCGLTYPSSVDECNAYECQEDPINNPPHYTKGEIQPLDVIDDWKLGFYLGNCVKYIARAPHKGKELEDLKKARFYLDGYIKKLEGK